jgi:hypothetical protein
MAYRNFTFTALENNFGIQQSFRNLFGGKQIVPVTPSAYLIETLERRQYIPTKTEKARNEFIIAPILAEIKLRNKDKIQLFSGEELSADRKLKLNGEVDFVFVHHPNAAELRDPIFSVTEAKKGAIEDGWAQNAAQLYGARVFNQNHNNEIKDIYGAVSNGSDWQFLFLEGNTIFIDEKVYSVNELPHLLGILQYIVELYQ